MPPQVIDQQAELARFYAQNPHPAKFQAGVQPALDVLKRAPKEMARIVEAARRSSRLAGQPIGPGDYRAPEAGQRGPRPDLIASASVDLQNARQRYADLVAQVDTAMQRVAANVTAARAGARVRDPLAGDPADLLKVVAAVEAQMHTGSERLQAAGLQLQAELSGQSVGTAPLPGWTEAEEVPLTEQPYSPPPERAWYDSLAPSVTVKMGPD